MEHMNIKKEEPDMDARGYVVIETMERDSALLFSPDHLNVMTLEEAKSVLKGAFEEDCKKNGFNPSEYTETGIEDDEAGFSKTGLSAYTNFRDNMDWKVAEIQRAI